MFCERCGKQLDPSLNYCNACGTQIKKEESQSRSLVSTLTSALISIAIVGLGVLVGLIAILMDKLNNPDPLFAFGAVYLFVLFGICFLITRQISKVIDADLRERGLAEKPREFVQLPPRSTNPLEEFRQPASVTDHTTRTLDKIPVQRS